MSKTTPMRPDGTGPDPNALAAGKFAVDREGKVLDVILRGATEGTNDAILTYLQANPPAGYRGLIREPTVRYFTKSAVEAGIIEARSMGGRTVYIPLEDGPSFARATPEGLDFRRRVLASSAPIVSPKDSSLSVGMVADRRAHVRQLMTRLQSEHLGTVSSTADRDRFSLAPGLPAASGLTDLPHSPSFIRSENGSLLFRAPAVELRDRLVAILPDAPTGGSPTRLEYRWSDLDPDILDRMFATISEIGLSMPSAKGTETPDTTSLPPKDLISPARRYWMLAAGEGARLWKDFKSQGVAAIGWGSIGDLRQYPDQEAIAKAILAGRGEDEGYPTNDSLACYQFAHEMREGDAILVKRGLTAFVGYGIVTSGYDYDPSRREYPNVRKVDWLADGEWVVPEGIQLAGKTLTDITNVAHVMDFILPLVTRAAAAGPVAGGLPAWGFSSSAAGARGVSASAPASGSRFCPPRR